MSKPVDAKESLTFFVTRNDVRKAKRASPTTCAVARGLCHSKASVLSVKIGRHVALVEYEDKTVRYEIPNEMRRKIIAFDKANYFEPGTYTLVPPRGWLTQKHMAQQFEKRHEAPKQQRKRGSAGRSVARSRQTIRHALRIGA